LNVRQSSGSFFSRMQALAEVVFRPRHDGCASADRRHLTIRPVCELRALRAKALAWTSTASLNRAACLIRLLRLQKSLSQVTSGSCVSWVCPWPKSEALIESRRPSRGRQPEAHSRPDLATPPSFLRLLRSRPHVSSRRTIRAKLRRTTAPVLDADRIERGLARRQFVEPRGHSLRCGTGRFDSQSLGRLEILGTTGQEHGSWSRRDGIEYPKAQEHPPDA